MSASETPPDLAGPAIRCFTGIAEAWRLSEDEQTKLLALDSPATIHSWRKGESAELGAEPLKRISYLLGIFKASNTLLPVAEQADGWVRRPNRSPLFEGRSALDRMLEGDIEGLQLVRRYLDAQLV